MAGILGLALIMSIVYAIFKTAGLKGGIITLIISAMVLIQDDYNRYEV